jgi:hypothetical protein
MRIRYAVAGPVVTLCLLLDCGSSSSPSGPSDGGSAGGGGGGGATAGGGGGGTGGGDGGGAGGGGGSGGQAATDLASAFCSRTQACSAFILQRIYGDLGTCVTRQAITFADVLNAPQTAVTGADLEACAQAVPGISCDDLFSRNYPQACRSTAGPLVTNAACGQDGQCQGAYCQIPNEQVCGNCGTLAASGGSCVRVEDCQYGLDCVNPASGGSCVGYAALNAACSSSVPCLPTLACIAGVCKAPLAGGATCVPSPNGEPCDFLGGYLCNPLSSQCTAVQLAGAGKPCGFSNTAIVLCAANGDCPSNTCVAAAADGAVCDAANGPVCVSPAVCVGGVCTLPNAAACR